MRGNIVRLLKPHISDPKVLSKLADSLEELVAVKMLESAGFVYSHILERVDVNEIIDELIKLKKLPLKRPN